MSKKGNDDIQSLIRSIQHDHGDGAVIYGDAPIKNIEAISTGVKSLDMALGIGGIPRGRVSEIFGPEGSGKTTVCLEIVKVVQDAGGIAAFIDVEHALDAYYASNGIGVRMPDLLLSQPDSGEEAFSIIEAEIESGIVDLIILDSVAALIPQAELESDISDITIGMQANLMSKALRKLKGIINQNRTALVFTNQLREVIGGMPFAKHTKTPGGRALKFYASVRIEIVRIGSVGKKGEDPDGNRVKCTIVKNKVAPPFRKTEFDIIYGEGADGIGNVLEIAEKARFIIRSGNKYMYGENLLGMSKAKAIDTIKDNDGLLEELIAKIDDARAST